MQAGSGHPPPTRSFRSINDPSNHNKSAKSRDVEDSYVCRISLCVTNRKAIIEHLDLSRYKTERCTRDPCRNPRTCPNFHSGDDFRRDPFAFPYSPELCEFGKNCFSRSKCQFSHNKYETSYHPKRYKTRYCKHLLEINQCKYGKYCGNAHNDQDIRIELLHTMAQDDDFYVFKYKTEFCPFQMEHNIRKCVYGHSWEDYRRNILVYPYSKSLCGNYQEVGFGRLEYRCPNVKNCKMSHNVFESDFHPQSYKKYPCQYPKCDGVGCPFLHREENPRFKVIEQRRDFYVYPYNRILPSTFVEKSSFFTARSANIY